MILIFDLDDTLYRELDFVESGFQAVAKYLELQDGIPAARTYESLLFFHNRDGRGRIFDDLLHAEGIFTQKLKRKLIAEYRKCSANLQLLSGVPEMLKSLNKQYPLYLVTDGNKFVQARKIEALKLDKYFKKIFITHRYGMSSAKPSLNCFQKIKKSEGVGWGEIIYVGDDPTKDFVSLNAVGARTIRVLQGRFAHHKADSKFDAKWSLQSISDLQVLLQEFNLTEKL